MRSIVENPETNNVRSGIGQAYWQVILGRITAGCGASGMVSLASVIITGEENW